MMMARQRSRWAVGAAVIMGLFLAPAALRAEDDADESLARARAAWDQQAKRGNELIDKLDLSRLQARKLVPIAEQAAALRVEAHETESRLVPEMAEAFAEFAREDSLNQGFSPAVERLTARLNHRAKKVREQLTEQLIDLEERASKLLKAEQRARLTDRQRKRAGVRARPARTDTRSRARAARRQREMQRRQPLADARRELNTLHQQRHPRVGPIGQYLLHPSVSDRLCKIARVKVPGTLSQAADVLENGSSGFSLAPLEQQKSEVRRLRGEISNWNLINGLHLSQDQIAGITSAYDQSTASSWEIVKRDRRSGVPHGKLASLEIEIEQVLNTGQRRVLADFKTCLIPPRNLKDPVRAGQVSNNSQYERWLERARKLSQRDLAKMINEGLEKEAERNGELSRKQRQQRTALLRRGVRKAAALSDTEFELSKAEMAEQIAPPDRIHAAKEKIAGLSRELGEPGAIAHLMINPSFMDQLRLRGRQLANGVATRQVDLAAGPQAENCDEGCAIDGKKSDGKKSDGKKSAKK